MLNSSDNSPIYKILGRQTCTFTSLFEKHRKIIENGTKLQWKHLNSASKSQFFTFLQLTQENKPKTNLSAGSEIELSQTNFYKYVPFQNIASL